MEIKKSKTRLLILSLSILLFFTGLTYFLYLHLMFPQLIPHYGYGERFSLSKVQNGTYSFQISWSAHTRLHLNLQTNSTVELYVNGTYLCDCTHYNFVIEEDGRALILLRSDLPVSGMFKAWQEIPLERQILALTLLSTGFIGIGTSIITYRRKLAYSYPFNWMFIEMQKIMVAR